MAARTVCSTRFCQRWAAEVGRLRLRANLTRRDLARAANLDPSYLTLIERDGYVPTELVCRALGVALGADLDLFLLEAGYASDRVRQTYLRARRINKKELSHV